VIVYMMVITAVVSTYLIQYNHQVFLWLNRGLERLGMRERLAAARRSSGTAGAPAHRRLVIVGFWRRASSLLHELLERDPDLRDDILVIDFNPDVKDALEHRGVHVVYGDVAHADTLEHAAAGDADVLVCTLPDEVLKGTSNTRLLRQLRAMAPQARIIVTADRLDTARELYGDGAAWVYVPRVEAVHRLADVVLESLEGDPIAARQAAEQDLASRDEVVP
jgi:voltage-gated potassium channel Kch